MKFAKNEINIFLCVFTLVSVYISVSPFIILKTADEDEGQYKEKNRYVSV